MGTLILYMILSKSCLEAAFTRGGLSRHHQGRTMVMFRGSPVPAPLHLLALQPVRCESAGASALHTLPFGFNPGDAAGTQGMGV